jgi:hypothetical protein
VFLLSGWIAALPYALNLIICLVVLRIQRSCGDRGPFIVGIVLSASSLVATSYVSDIYVMFGTYCLLFGVGSSLVMYVPFAVLDWHFPEDHPRRVLATSIVTLGAPIGKCELGHRPAHRSISQPASQPPHRLSVHTGASVFSSFLYWSLRLKAFIWLRWSVICIEMLEFSMYYII